MQRTQTATLLMKTVRLALSEAARELELALGVQTVAKTMKGPDRSARDRDQKMTCASRSASAGKRHLF